MYKHEDALLSSSSPSYSSSTLSRPTRREKVRKCNKKRAAHVHIYEQGKTRRVPLEILCVFSEIKHAHTQVYLSSLSSSHKSLLSRVTNI